MQVLCCLLTHIDFKINTVTKSNNARTFLTPFPSPQRARGTCSISFRACHKDYKTWHCLFWSTGHLIQPHVNPKKPKKNWKTENPKNTGKQEIRICTIFIYTVYIWMRAKVFRLAVCRISRICGVICHVEDSHMRGDLHDIVPRGVANSTWRCNCNCNLDNLDNS